MNGVVLSFVLSLSSTVVDHFPEMDPVEHALITDDDGALRKLLNEGTSINRPISEARGMSPLMEAAQHGALKNVKLLLKFHADPNLQAAPKFRSVPWPPVRWTALCFAHGANSLEAARLLLEGGAQPAPPCLHDADFYGAASRGDAEAAGRLAQEKPPPQALAQLAMSFGVAKHNSSLIQVALRAGARANGEERESGLSPMQMALSQGDSATVLSLLKGGAKPEGITLLAGKGETELVAAFLEAGANPNAPEWDSYGEGPLHQAARHGHLETVKLLLAKGADVNAKGGQDRTPIESALLAHDTRHAVSSEVIDALVKAGADLTQEDSSKRDALVYAAQSCSPESITLVFKAYPKKSFPQGAAASDLYIKLLQNQNFCMPGKLALSVRALRQAGLRLENQQPLPTSFTRDANVRAELEEARSTR